ncbi:MAG: HNH endonuclease [Anaerolineae bacterium]
MNEHYINAFRKLKTDKSKSRWDERTTYRAPHKPILLLSVIDLFAQGSITANLIELTPELGELFTFYWATIFPPQTGKRGNIALPYFFLKSDGFWHLVPRPGKETILAATRKIQAVTHLQELTLGARLDEDLYALLQTEDGRSRLRHTLITTYFTPDLQEALLKQTEVNVAAFEYSEILLEEARQEHTDTIKKLAEKEKPVRDQGFRHAIVKIYEHRCAICGIRILTVDGHTAIAAAHIIPWSKSHNDHPRNGLALCHLCHWVFDEGLVAFTDKYHIKASPQLSAASNLPGHLLGFVGKGLIGPSDEVFWPFLDSIRWHRKHVFRSH